MQEPITNRHDILLLFEVTNGNPNGDPDAGNMPRIDPTTNRGLVSDVCIKRKVRNYVEMFPADRGEPESNGFDILIQQGAVIEKAQKKAIELVKKNGDIAGKSEAERTKNWLSREFYDVRTFGGVLSTGDDVMRGSAYGQVRGPVQFTFAQSLHPITPLEVSITRCAVTKEADQKKERTMGNKHIVPYALYVAKGYVSPAFAENTLFTQQDLDLLFEALAQMFEHDRSSARGEMVVRGLLDFEHVGTQGPNNAQQNLREAKLGCAHAHQLFECVETQLKEGVEFPKSFKDYEISIMFDEYRFPGVKLHKRVDPTP